jgi:orotidine-5'-phosphate decarboxylase
MMNVHASGGEAMMRAAREAIAGSARPPLLIAVTVLTSLDDAALDRIGFRGKTHSVVERLSALTRDCGLDGVVCSAQEAPSLRKLAAGQPFALVTPGIRLAGAKADDQSRVVTPMEAVQLGADYLVIGRPITGSPDPVATLRDIQESLQEARA